MYLISRGLCVYFHACVPPCLASLHVFLRFMLLVLCSVLFRNSRLCFRYPRACPLVVLPRALASSSRALLANLPAIAGQTAARGASRLIPEVHLIARRQEVDLDLMISRCQRHDQGNLPAALGRSDHFHRPQSRCNLRGMELVSKNTRAACRSCRETPHPCLHG